MARVLILLVQAMPLQMVDLEGLLMVLEALAALGMAVVMVEMAARNFLSGVAGAVLGGMQAQVVLVQLETIQ
jgi:hypothetical protein